jgi:hypothetical protein
LQVKKARVESNIAVSKKILWSSIIRTLFQTHILLSLKTLAITRLRKMKFSSLTSKTIQKTTFAATVVINISTGRPLKSQTGSLFMI